MNELESLLASHGITTMREGGIKVSIFLWGSQLEEVYLSRYEDLDKVDSAIVTYISNTSQAKGGDIYIAYKDTKRESVPHGKKGFWSRFI